MLNRFLRAAFVGGTGLAVLIPSLAPAQTTGERFWIAFRFDSTRVAVYFDSTKYLSEPPPEMRLRSASTFLDVAVLPEAEARRMAERPGAARFAPGDTYDLLLDGGHVAVVTLTSFVTAYGGEARIGNQQYIGALATIDSADRAYFTRGHYALTTHRPGRPAVASSARLETRAPSSADSARIRKFFRDRFEKAVRRDATLAAVRVTLAIQQVILANGARRFYVQASWERPRRSNGCSVSAWLLRDTVGTDSVSRLACSGDPIYTRRVLAAVDLGNGGTGLVLSEWVPGSYDGVSLVEYHAGRLTRIQSMGIGG